ncbi:MULTISPECIES: hypothetical protein [Lysobacter]|uniref:hypothetical protein n=1 Tax=Lysobacter TaxID=68 RepID=UPI001F325BAB|nr:MULTISPECIES: hypothetical protein [Lysobacter]UJB19744.1 hypothetical protein L1A79_01185 [Lysobacter capsici]UJQ26530.1 hypothetical protein L2D09_13675 [Lysobacter gummosus]
MQRQTIKLKRNPRSPAHATPLAELVVTAMNGVPGATDARVDRSESDDLVTSFLYAGRGDASVPEEYFDRFGLMQSP